MEILFFGEAFAEEKKDCNGKPDPKEEIGVNGFGGGRQFPTDGYAQMNFILAIILTIFVALQKLGLTGFDSKING